MQKYHILHADYPCEAYHTPRDTGGLRTSKQCGITYIHCSECDRGFQDYVDAKSCCADVRLERAKRAYDERRKKARGIAKRFKLGQLDLWGCERKNNQQTQGSY